MHNVILFFVQVAIAAVLAVKIVCDFTDNSELEDDENKNETAADTCTVDNGSNNG